MSMAHTAPDQISDHERECARSHTHSPVTIYRTGSQTACHSKPFDFNVWKNYIAQKKALNLFISTQFIYFIAVDNQNGGYLLYCVSVCVSLQPKTRPHEHTHTRTQNTIEQLGRRRIYDFMVCQMGLNENCWSSIASHPSLWAWLFESWLSQHNTHEREHQFIIHSGHGDGRKWNCIYFPFLSMASSNVSTLFLCSLVDDLLPPRHTAKTWRNTRVATCDDTQSQRHLPKRRVRAIVISLWSLCRFRIMQAIHRFSPIFDSIRRCEGEIWQIMTFSCYWMVKILLLDCCCLGECVRACVNCARGVRVMWQCNKNPKIDGVHKFDEFPFRRRIMIIIPFVRSVGSFGWICEINTNCRRTLLSLANSNAMRIGEEKEKRPKAINGKIINSDAIFTCVSDKFNACARAFRSAPTTYWLLSNACSSFSNWPGENAVRTRFGFLNGCSKKSEKWIQWKCSKLIKPLTHLVGCEFAFRFSVFCAQPILAADRHLSVITSQNRTSCRSKNVCQQRAKETRWASSQM